MFGEKLACGLLHAPGEARIPQQVRRQRALGDLTASRIGVRKRPIETNRVVLEGEKEIVDKIMDEANLHELVVDEVGALLRWLEETLNGGPHLGAQDEQGNDGV